MNQRQAIQAISNREHFIASALSGHPGAPNGEGKLDPQEIAQLRADQDAIDYTVLSYWTPIAWHTTNGWYHVAQRFSRTTSCHQSKVRQAVAR